MKKHPHRQIAAHYPLRFVAYLVDRYGCNVSDLLQVAGLDSRVLDGSLTSIPDQAYFNLMEEGRRIAGDDGIALTYGNSLKLSDLGLLGYTVTSEATLGDALSLLTRYYGGQAHLSLLSLVRSGEFVRLRVQVVPGLAEAATRFLVESILAAVTVNMERLGFRDRYQTRAEFAYATPGYSSLYRSLVSPRVHFDMQTSALVIPAAWLGQPLRQQSDVAGEELRLRLQSLLSRPQETDSLRERMEEMVKQALPERLVLEAAAAQLGLSARALQRRLQQRGETLREISESVRMQLAERWLRDSRISVADIGRQLGYQEPASFTRAFRIWKGVSPSRFRQSGSVQ